jgi:hypothetical protein
MGNKSTSQRRVSNGAALTSSSNGQIPTIQHPQALLVQQHQQRMTRRSSEIRNTPVEFSGLFDPIIDILCNCFFS